jgi:predicted Zn-dependent peptidase
MRAFYDRLYLPSNAVLVVVGDCDAARVFARAERYFGPLESTPAPPAADVSEDVPGREERSAVQKAISSRAPVIGIGYRLPARTTRAFPALSVLNTVLGRDARGLLRRALVDEKQLATSVTASFHDLGNDLDFDGPMLYTIMVEVSAGHSPAEILGEVDGVMARVRQGLSSADLADARLRHAMWFLDQLAGPGNAHATRAKTIGAFTLFEGTPEGINRVLPETAALTDEDLRAAARTYLVSSNRVWIARQPE